MTRAERTREIIRKYRLSDKGKATRRAYQRTPKARLKSVIRARLNARRLKEAIVNMYSNGEAVCAWCGQGDMDVLTIDHIDNNGAAHRKSEDRPSSWSYLYAWLRNHDYPVGFQVLCFNCNWKKASLFREKLLREKMEMIA